MNILDAVHASADRAYTLPPQCYGDPEILRLEQKHLFAGGWVSAGREDQLPNPGDYFALSIGETPIVVIRGSDGQPRAFANTCRHRGMRLLAPGRGTTQRLVCPFHGWCYALDGVLTAAPRMDNAQGFERSDFALVEVSSAVQDGFVFVNIDSMAGSVDDWLGDFSELHRPWRLDSLRLASARAFTVKCNWKLFIEVFNEYYHLRKVHPGTLSALYQDPDPPEEVSGSFISQFGEHAKIGSVGVLGADTACLPPLPGLTGRLANGTRYTWVYPGLSFAASRDAVWMLEALPLKVDETAVRLSLLFDPEAIGSPHFDQTLANYEARMRIAMDEDIEVLEAQQEGISSPLAKPGRICPELEPSVHAFHQWYAGRLSEWSVSLL